MGARNFKFALHASSETLELPEAFPLLLGQVLTGNPPTGDPDDGIEMYWSSPNPGGGGPIFFNRFTMDAGDVGNTVLTGFDDFSNVLTFAGPILRIDVNRNGVMLREDDDGNGHYVISTGPDTITFDEPFDDNEVFQIYGWSTADQLALPSPNDRDYSLKFLNLSQERDYEASHLHELRQWVEAAGVSTRPYWDDQIVWRFSDGGTRLYKANKDVPLGTAFSLDDWDPMVDDNIPIFDVAQTYIQNGLVLNNDAERPQWITTYQNTSGNVLSPGAFNPADWTRVSSSMATPWGMELSQTGLLTGGEMTETDVDEITIAPGTGVVVDKLDLVTPVITYVEWDTPIVVPLPNLAADRVEIISLDENGAAVITASGSSSTMLSRNTIILGTVVEDPLAAGEIGVLVDQPLTSHTVPDSVVDLHRYYHKPKYVRGGIPSGVMGVLQIATTAGEIYSFNRNYRTDPANPHEILTPSSAAITFRYIDLNGALDTPATLMDVKQYETAPGVLSPVPLNSGHIQRLFFDLDTLEYRLQWAQNIYSSFGEALSNITADDLLTPLPYTLQQNVVFVAWVVLDEAAISSANPAVVSIRALTDKAIFGPVGF